MPIISRDCAPPVAFKMDTSHLTRVDYYAGAKGVLVTPIVAKVAIERGEAVLAGTPMQDPPPARMR